METRINESLWHICINELQFDHQWFRYALVKANSLSNPWWMGVLPGKSLTTPLTIPESQYKAI